jgi:hypothetical protein
MDFHVISRAFPERQRYSRVFSRQTIQPTESVVPWPRVSISWAMLISTQYFMKQANTASFITDVRDLPSIFENSSHGMIIGLYVLIPRPVGSKLAARSSEFDAPLSFWASEHGLWCLSRFLWQHRLRCECGMLRFRLYKPALRRRIEVGYYEEICFFCLILQLQSLTSPIRIF